MSRGPKPPIAPKPVLSPSSERRSTVNANNFFNKCANGKVVCPVENISNTDQYSLESGTPDMTFEDYSTVPDSQFTDEENTDIECEHSSSFDTWETHQEEVDISDNKSCSPSGVQEEDSGNPDSVPSREVESGESTELEDSDNTDALSLRSSSTADADSLVPHTGCETLLFKNDLGDIEDFLPLDHNECNTENKANDKNLKIMGCDDVILTEVYFEELPVDETCCEEDANTEETPCKEHDESPVSTEVDLVNVESLENSIVCDNAQCGEAAETEQDLVAESLDNFQLTEDIADLVNDDGQDSFTHTNELSLCNLPSFGDEEGEQEADTTHEMNELAANNIILDNEKIITNILKSSEDTAHEDSIDDSCLIVPYENEGSEEPDETLEAMVALENGLDINPVSEPLLETVTDDTECFSDDSCCNRKLETTDAQVTFTGAAEGNDWCDEEPSAVSHVTVTEVDLADTTDYSTEDQEREVKEMDSTDVLPVTEVITEPEEEDEANPYVLEDSAQSRSRKLLSAKESAHNRNDGDTQRPYCTGEKNGCEGENHLLNVDRKNIVTRTRSYSGKIPGNVPETVPEETGAEFDSQLSNSEKKAIREKMDKKPIEAGRALPRKPSRFIPYPRSYSVEGRENTVSLYIESDMVVNFSSPYLISSSGSFSQRNHHSSSGMSTPSSVVDIPPPFELASITKKPITKSSPSLLIENECSEKCNKKKKLSFKRFLTLKFKKKTENKVHVEVNVSSPRSSSESSYHGAARHMDTDRRSLGNSPQLQARSGLHFRPDSPSAMLFYKDMKRKGTSKAFNRSVARVESFEDRSRPPFMPLPLTKPRSISFPNADTSDYENIPAMNSDYENIQIPPQRPARAGTFTEFFEDPCRALSSANENDGYVDMSSFNTFEIKQLTADQEAESAYTEPYKVCPILASTVEDITSDEEPKSSEEEGNCLGEPGVVQKKDGPMRALNIIEGLLSSEKEYVDMLKRLHIEFHTAVLRVLGSEEEDGEDELKLRHGLSGLLNIYLLHEEILAELELRISHWEESQKIADIFLSRKSDFQHHTAFIVAFDKMTAALDDCTIKTSYLATVVRDFERYLHRGQANVKHELLKVVQRIFQYHMILTDYLNNLCPDWAEYEDTLAALMIVSEVADRANDSMRQGENLQKLVQIEHSVRGQRSLLQPGREFVKEGTLMKVSGRNKHPRHLFLMNDVLLYTYPLKDGKYRLKNTLSIPGMRVSRPIVENAQNVLKVECMERCLMLSASSCTERDEWYSCISRTVQEYYKAPTVSIYNNLEIRERLGMGLGERPPSVAHMSHAVMCMNCGSDFSLTLRRHHCHACGKIVCRSCSRNKYPLKYLKDRPSKVCDGCFAELRKRDLAAMNMNASPLLPRSTSTLSTMFHSIHPSYFRRQKKIPSALMEAAASGENSSICGYLHWCKKGKKYWKKRWFVIKGKVLYTYTACEDKVATESLPLLGFHIVPDNWNEKPKLGTVFQLYHKKTLFYSFKAADTNAAIRWVEAIKAASVL
ncbi:FYVE, RhoGEF and PH domain-containing protein 5 isoform X2 [Xenopus laevis]|nr:FYVE, RhoGEF and PH domain-containing protein 5 isoform X2 [Xenopus laevis]